MFYLGSGTRAPFPDPQGCIGTADNHGRRGPPPLDPSPPLLPIEQPQKFCSSAFGANEELSTSTTNGGGGLWPTPPLGPPPPPSCLLMQPRRPPKHPQQSPGTYLWAPKPPRAAVCGNVFLLDLGSSMDVQATDIVQPKCTNDKNV